VNLIDPTNSSAPSVYNDFHSSIYPIVRVHTRRFMDGGVLEVRAIIPELIHENSPHFSPLVLSWECQGAGYESN
jgi:hypothetical protein